MKALKFRGFSHLQLWSRSSSSILYLWYRLKRVHRPKMTVFALGGVIQVCHCPVLSHSPLSSDLLLKDILGRSWWRQGTMRDLSTCACDLDPWTALMTSQETVLGLVWLPAQWLKYNRWKYGNEEKQSQFRSSGQDRHCNTGTVNLVSFWSFVFFLTLWLIMKYF